MKTRAAIVRNQPSEWEVIEADLDEPKEFEVLVQNVATGLCHSDDHISKGDVSVGTLPFCGGHEAAGIVRAVGPSVRSLTPGDHIVTSFTPCCGRCRFCAGGQQNLCDNGAMMAVGCQLDGTFRLHHDGQDVGQSGFMGAFSEWSVMPEMSCIKISKEIPLESAALLGCGVPTGWGSAVNAAQVQPGDVVVVVGVGGVGINAVQGASHAGAGRVIAVDPVAFKRTSAMKVGATDAVESISEAGELAASITNGQGADSVILTVDVLKGEHIGPAFDIVRKAGTLVVVSVANQKDASIPVNPLVLSMYQKRVQGVLYGMMSPHKDVPRLLALYQQGSLKLDELVSRTYTLDQINTGFDDMKAGVNIRGLIRFDV